MKRFRHLVYLEAGPTDGPPLFLLHGGTMTARWNWEDALPALAARYRVIAPDTAGHGHSGNPRPDLRYEDMVEDVLSLAESLGIERAAIYGFSDGGQVALELAIREPAFPVALVLSGVLHELTPDYRAAMLDFAGAPHFAEPAWSARQPQLSADCRRNHADWDALAPQVWDLWMRPLELGHGRLARVAAPALILTGDRDPFAALEQTVALLRRLPGAELAVIPGAAHSYDEPFTAAALQFLDRHVPAVHGPAPAGDSHAAAADRHAPVADGPGFAADGPDLAADRHDPAADGHAAAADRPDPSTDGPEPAQCAKAPPPHATSAT